MVSYTILFFVCVLVLMGCQTLSPPTGTEARIGRVISGQTLEVLISSQSNQVQRVRLIGLAAPAWKQEPWFSQAKQYLAEHVSAGSTVRLETDVEPSVTYADGTTIHLAYIWQGDRLLNEQVIAAGWALAEERSPNVKYSDRLRNAQEQARLLGKGVWNPTKPMRQTPDEFSRSAN